MANSGPTVWNRIDGMKVSWNNVKDSTTHETPETCLSWCLTFPTCVALEYRSGNSHCALDSKGRFEAGSDWQPTFAPEKYNYYDFYYATRGMLSMFLYMHICIWFKLRCFISEPCYLQQYFIAVFQTLNNFTGNLICIINRERGLNESAFWWIRIDMAHSLLAFGDL